MILSDLITEVQDIVQDESVATPAKVTVWLNGANTEAASRVDIPDLRASGVVVTSTTLAYVSIPSTYQRKLFQVSSAEQEKSIVIKENLAEILLWYPLLDKVSDVNMVAVEQGLLWYQGVPETADTLTLYFYRKPVAMSANTDQPDGIPDHLQLEILVPYAAKRAFSRIEQGIDGQKVNTLEQDGIYEIGLKKLRRFVTPQGIDFRA